MCYLELHFVMYIGIGPMRVCKPEDNGFEYFTPISAQMSFYGLPAFLID